MPQASVLQQIQIGFHNTRTAMPPSALLRRTKVEAVPVAQGPVCLRWRHCFTRSTGPGMHPFSPSCAPSSTSSTAAQPTPQLFCIHPGQAHALVVPAGSELFCSHGSLLLHSGPQGLVDGAPSLQWQLSTGQRWRENAQKFNASFITSSAVNVRFEWPFSSESFGSLIQKSPSVCGADINAVPLHRRHSGSRR